MIGILMVFLAGILVGVGVAVYSCHKMADIILASIDDELAALDEGSENKEGKNNEP